ncbi:DUF746 domain-containing protein [Burkholderia cepacia]|uniref:DUF746 domain-containing protein n=1 Tax=Burkholderia cepacia TaxID=292 RepID=UPI001FC7F5EC|nr:DUF746 domain-containing protein [Burkholderia cepacia]
MKTPAESINNGAPAPPAAPTPPQSALEDQAAFSSRAAAMIALLTRRSEQLMSPHVEPLPVCPRCTSLNTRGHAIVQHRTGPLPNYLCRSCDRVFNRLTGTPLAGALHRHQLQAFIPLLAEPISLEEAARRLSSKGDSVATRVRVFRRWLLELDPSGELERSVQLGGQLTAVRDEAPVFPENGTREDVVLTATLTADFDDIHSADNECPPCAMCGSHAIRRKGRLAGLPLFYCNHCRKKFNRRTGTPFVRQKEPHKQRELIRYLGLPLSVTQMAEILSTDPFSIRRWIRNFTQRCAQLDPSGQLVARFRIGARPNTQTPCASCGQQQLKYSVEGHAVRGCCGQIFSMWREVSEKNGTLEIGPSILHEKIEPKP